MEVHYQNQHQLHFLSAFHMFCLQDDTLRFKPWTLIRQRFRQIRKRKRPDALLIHLSDLNGSDSSSWREACRSGTRRSEASEFYRTGLLYLLFARTLAQRGRSELQPGSSSIHLWDNVSEFIHSLCSYLCSHTECRFTFFFPGAFTPHLAVELLCRFQPQWVLIIVDFTHDSLQMSWSGVQHISFKLNESEEKFCHLLLQNCWQVKKREKLKRWCGRWNKHEKLLNKWRSIYSRFDWNVATAQKELGTEHVAHRLHAFTCLRLWAGGGISRCIPSSACA